MRYTVSYFRPEEHCPESFLCQQVVLPELEGFSPRLRQILETPILSPDQVDDWCEAMEWFSNGYDEKLAPNHWGVFTARTLEALFWRVVDISNQNPRWPRGISLPPVNEITVYCDTMSLHNLARDLMVLFSQTTPEEKTDGLDIRYPDIKTDRFFLNDQEEGNARAHAFWAPLYPAMVVQALAAWEALRFTSKQDLEGRPRRFRVDMDLVCQSGALEAMGSLFGPASMAAIKAFKLQQSTQPVLRSSSPSSPRL